MAKIKKSEFKKTQTEVAKAPEANPANDYVVLSHRGGRKPYPISRKKWENEATRRAIQSEGYYLASVKEVSERFQIEEDKEEVQAPLEQTKPEQDDTKQNDKPSNNELL